VTNSLCDSIEITGITGMTLVKKYVTRIQSRLAIKGVKLSLSEIRDVYTRVCINPEYPIEDELDTVTYYFLNPSERVFDAFLKPILPFEEVKKLRERS